MLKTARKDPVLIALKMLVFFIFQVRQIAYSLLYCRHANKQLPVALLRLFWKKTPVLVQFGAS